MPPGNLQALKIPPTTRKESTDKGPTPLHDVPLLDARTGIAAQSAVAYPAHERPI
jgi:hypothetical protein